MFSVIAGGSVDNLRLGISKMATAMRGSPQEPRIYIDVKRRFAVCGTSTGILPEDRFDLQPYVSPHLCFVATGRIDNRLEILHSLSLTSDELTTLSDSALLHVAYQRWGAACGQHLAGQYSFCAIHVVTGEVVVGVDHVAMAQVLYAEVNGSLVLATQMGAMLKHPLLQGLSPDVHATALLVAGRSPVKRTAYEGVSTILGGHTLHWRERQNAELRRWWNPQVRGRISYRNSEDYVEHANIIFKEAVRNRLRAQSAISASVSGGLDSALVAGTAALELRHTNEMLAMYTSAPEQGIPCFQRQGWDSDEAGLVQQLAARHPNTSHALVGFEGTSPLDVVRETHAASHTPVRNTANQVWLRAICRMAAAQGSRVLLTGERGNATVSLGSDASIGRILFRRPLLALELARRDAKNGGRLASRTLFSELRHGAQRLLKRTSSPWPVESYLSKEMRRRVVPGLTAIGDLRTPAAQEAFAAATQRAWVRDEIVHSGVEFRDPTSDKRLIELSLSFPPEAFFAGGRPRGLAREIGRDLLPDSIRLRRRRGMQVPEHCGIIALHGNRYREALQDLNDSTACQAHLDLARGRQDLERLCRGELDLRAAVTIDRMLDVGLFWREHGI